MNAPMIVQHTGLRQLRTPQRSRLLPEMQIAVTLIGNHNMMLIVIDIKQHSRIVDITDHMAYILTSIVFQTMCHQ